MKQVKLIRKIERCPQCKKILFRKKNGNLVCPNECQQSGQRSAFNTMIDPMKDRRILPQFDPWEHVKI